MSAAKSLLITVKIEKEYSFEMLFILRICVNFKLSFFFNRLHCLIIPFQYEILLTMSELNNSGKNLNLKLAGSTSLPSMRLFKPMPSRFSQYVFFFKILALS